MISAQLNNEEDEKRWRLVVMAVLDEGNNGEVSVNSGSDLCNGVQ